MIEVILQAAFRRAALTVLLVLLVVGVGAASYRDLATDVFPDLSAPVFNLIVQNPVLAPEELEQAIAVPLEAALAGLSGVRRVRSSSQLGVATVTIEFEPDADYHRSRQLVAERLGQLQEILPPGTEPPLLSSLTGRLNEILELTLEADPSAADLMALRDLGEFTLKGRLLAVPGVAAVETLGGYLREFQVQLEPARMRARGVTLEQVLHAVEDTHENAAGGFLVRGATEWTVRSLGRITTLEELRKAVVIRREGTPVMLGDVADIREGGAIRRGMAHRMLGEVVSLRISKQFGADTVAVSQALNRALEDLRPTLPAGITLKVVYDQAQLVERSLSTVGRSIGLGALLVLGVLLVLLGDFRAAMLVILTLPLSVALAGILLKPLGIGINTMTLGGLAIALGLLVDAAIILSENLVHHFTNHTRAGGTLSPGMRRKEGLKASLEVGRPITFATLIVVAVFLPLYAMSGIEGRMYRPLAVAVASAMLAALVLSLTLVPILGSRLLSGRPAGVPEDPGLVRLIKRAYVPVLERVLRQPMWVLLVSILGLVLAGGLAARIGTEFMPEIDEGALLLQTSIPVEASLEQVDRMNHRIEDVLRSFPEVVDVVRRTGRAERTEDPMPHTISDVLVLLTPERTRRGEVLEEALRHALSSVPGVSVLFTTPLGMRIDEGLGGTPADLSVRIFGPDLDVLARLANETLELLEPISGLEDLRAEQLTGFPQIQVQVDRDAAARHGVHVGEVARAIRVGLAGLEVSEVVVGNRRLSLTVRLAESYRNDLDALRNLLIDTEDGQTVPLYALASIQETVGPGSIRREAGSRRIAVEASVSGRDLGSVAAAVRSRLQTGLTLPTGYFVDVGGRVESQTRARQALLTATATALALVVMLLYLALGSWLETGIILGTLPVALVGGVVGLWASGETWNVSSFVGLIGLFGIAIQNSLVLLSQLTGLLKSGLPFEQAIREASVGRVRPKLMTAATAILGLLPLVMLHGEGSEIERPLAVVMIGGLVTSTLFTLLALPTFLGWVERQRPGFLTPTDEVEPTHKTI